MAIRICDNDGTPTNLILDDGKIMSKARGKMKEINICGIPHKIIYDDVIDEEEYGVTQGKIYYTKCEIHLKNGMPSELEEEVLTHEILHGILNHLGKSDLSSDEEFVQLLAHGIFEHFKVRT